MNISSKLNKNQISNTITLNIIESIDIIIYISVFLSDDFRYLNFVEIRSQIIFSPLSLLVIFI